MSQVKYYVSLLVGTFILSLSFTLLQGPNQIASGGITGASLVFGYLFHIPSFVILLMATVVLLLVSVYFLGVQSILKSVVGSLLIPMFVYMTSELSPLTNDPLLASIYGGLGVGVGLGIVFSVGGNTGGFTLISQILHKVKAVKPSTSVIIMDAAIIVLGGIVFSPENALYALVGAFVTRKTMDLILGDKSRSKVAYIISSKEYETRIIESVIHELDRGLTKITGAGGYTNSERTIMMIVLDPLKVTKLRTIIQEIDPHAFIIFCEATEVFGEGFTKTFPSTAVTKLDSA